MCSVGSYRSILDEGVGMIGFLARMLIELLSGASEGTDPNYVRNKYAKRRPGGAKGKPARGLKKKK
jgi:hypothetical protein